MLVTILVFLLILSILVLVHEAGHFFVAKFFKIKVEEFGFGLPPRAFGKKIGETIYSINWLPIGGFVKLYGEDEAGGGKPSFKVQSSKLKDKDRTFFAKPAWQRALVVVAGVVMNFVLAVLIISFLFSVVGVPVPIKVNVVDIVKDSPAEKAGLKVGYVIESVDNIKIVDSNTLVAYTEAHLGRELRLVVTKNNKEETLKVLARKDHPKDQGAMGVRLEQITTVKKYPWYQAPIVGTKEALKVTWMIVNGLGGLIAGLVTKGAIPQDVAGPVGIAQLTGRVVEIGPFAVLSLISLLSLNLAIINILPIPALDGGRLFFILFEIVTRKKVNPKYEGYAHTVGMAVLLGLIALITLHDLFRLFTGQSILPK